MCICTYFVTSKHHIYYHNPIKYDKCDDYDNVMHNTLVSRHIYDAGELKPFKTSVQFC